MKWKKKYVALMALALLGCCGAQTTQPQAPVAKPEPASPLPLSQLQQMIEKGDAAGALKQLDTLAAENPVPAGVKLAQGKALYALNRLVDAEAAFAAALAQDPQDAEAAQMDGLTLFRLGRPNDAIPLLTGAQKWTAQTRFDPSYILALCYMDTRRFDDARHAFAAQYGFAPDSASAYLLAARMLFRREFLPVAQSSAEKSIELEPG